MKTDVLFKPFECKTLKLNNRIVMAPMTRTQSPNGIPTEAVAQYYKRRAEGGVGLILSEGTVINARESSGDPSIPHFYGAESLQGWKSVIDGVHQAGGKMAPQIWHMGYVPRTAPGEMSVADIHEAIDGYAKAALDAKNLGFDTVEIHGAHGYLIDQFFWSGSNTRTDEFGGKTIAAKNKFGVEVVKAIRAKVGESFPIIIRLSQWKQQDYAAKIATTAKEMEEWLLPLSEAGADIFHCSQRRVWEPEFEGSDLNFAGWAKKITGKPTISVGSVGITGGDFIQTFKGEAKEIEVAALDEIVRRMERGDFDLVAVGRALLSDPQWANKVKEGRMDDIKPFNKEDMKVLT